jgi:hypothetical protein
MDAHGQPDRALRYHAVTERQIDEMIGLCKGIMADGAVCQGEAEFLLGWMEANRQAMGQWPASVLYPRIAAMLADGVLDGEEERELLGLLGEVTGFNAPAAGEASGSSSMPLCKPAPAVVFEGVSFCFTGQFYSGSRAWCEEQVLSRGGVPASAVTKKLGYLVIGEVGSRDWLHSTFGTKIKKAIEYRDKGVGLAIIDERHWCDALALYGV